MKRVLALFMVLVMLLVFMASTALAGPADEPLWTGLRSNSLHDLHEPGEVAATVHRLLTLRLEGSPPGLAK